jgi:four helix bundle protein
VAPTSSVSVVWNLLVYRRAAALADEVRATAAEWGAFDRWTVGVQLVRATDSIGANVAEAFGRWGLKDQRRLLYVARGSAYETVHWLERAAARELPLPAGALAGANELSRMLNGLIARHRTQAQQLRTKN